MIGVRDFDLRLATGRWYVASPVTRDLVEIAIDDGGRTLTWTMHRQQAIDLMRKLGALTGWGVLQPELARGAVEAA